MTRKMHDRRTCSLILLAFLAAILTGRSAFAQYRIYWGDVHGHTSLSDGKGSLDDYFTHARDVAKLDFVIVTDHDFGSGPPWRMPKEKWQLTQNKADEYTVNGKFVAIAGYEWTSQAKYWTPAEPLFKGPPKLYNHKDVYFPSRVDYLFSAKDAAYNSPNLLAEVVLKHGGLVHNNHPFGEESRDQWDYAPVFESVIVNSEMGTDVMRYNGKEYKPGWEKNVREFLNLGRKTGFVAGTDTYEGKTAARTGVLARELIRSAIFEALRHRRNYAVSNARIVLDFKINGHGMGEEIEVEGNPRITVDVQGTDKVREVSIIRDGSVVHSRCPNVQTVRFEYVDSDFGPKGYYYVRVTQVDSDEHGNPSRAWSSPIWVRKK